jgi:hypothetical protein
MNDEPNVWDVEAHSEGVCADNDIRGWQYPADEPAEKHLPIVCGAELGVIERELNPQGSQPRL